MHRVSNNTCGKSVEYNTYLWEKNYFVIKFIHYSKSNYIKNIKRQILNFSNKLIK